MKTTISFSVDENIARSFNRDAGEKRNTVIEKLMYDYVNQGDDTVIKCKVCGAVYSKILTKCPQCKVTENLKLQAEHGMTLEQMKNRIEALTRKSVNNSGELDSDEQKELSDLREIVSGGDNNGECKV